MEDNLGTNEGSQGGEKEPTPTEASQGFLRDYFNKTLRLYRKTGPFIVPAATVVIGNSIVGGSIQTDIAQGDYRRVVVKGAIAGLGVALGMAPTVVKAIKERRMR